jgi:hypothetical protein
MRRETMMTIILAAAAMLTVAIGSAYTGDPISAIIHLTRGSRRWRKFI